MLSNGEEEIIMHNGKRYRQVQIENEDENYLMDDQQNIYTLNFEKIGERAEESDEEDREDA